MPFFTLAFDLPVLLVTEVLASGPATGDAVAPAEVYALSGDAKDQTVNLAAFAKERRAVFVFIDAARWDRRMFRFLKALEAKLGEGDSIAAIWLTQDVDQTKEYLPKISSYFNKTVLCLFEQGPNGPKDWGINPDASLTAVVANRGKVVKSFGYRVVDETDASEVADSLKPR
ncbi:MAG: hypothetical protein N2039_08400 [Gemmataceae bacterium]|nr:hypothetical protein [Gemmataceae bacterium]